MPRWFFALCLGMVCITASDSAAAQSSRSARPGGGSPDSVSTTDQLQILTLIARYSHTFDSRDASGWAALFVDEAPFTIYMAGALDLTLRTNAERLKWARETHEYLVKAGVQNRHFQTNTVLSPRADGSVEGATFLMGTWQLASETVPKLMHTGVYRDVFIRTAQGWRIASRELRVDHK